MNYKQIHEIINQNALQNKRLAGMNDKDIKNQLRQQLSYQTIPLHQVTSSFFEPNSLRLMAQEEIFGIDRKGNIFHDKKIPKYYMSFGNTYGLNDARLNSITLHNLKFPASVIEFIANSFEKPSNEEENIKESIANANNRIFIILERHTINSPGVASKSYKHTDSIVAVVVCHFQQSGCNLLWFASSKKKHQNKGVASLLLATAQTCQEIMHGNNVIICQANIKASVSFYLQHHFEIITKANKEIYKKCKESLDKIGSWLTHKELRLLKSRAKVNVLHTWMYEDTMETDAFDLYIIPQLVKNYFPDVKELHNNNNVDVKIVKNILNGINTTYNIESFNWSSCLEGDIDDEVDKTNPTVYAGHKTLETLVDIDNCCIDPPDKNILLAMPEILSSHRNDDHTDDLFQLMSSILYSKNIDHETDIRCFLGFLYSCFSVLNDDHPFFTYSKGKTKVASNNLQSINIRKELCKRLEDEYNSKELTKYLKLSDGRKFKDPRVIKMAFKLLKCHIIPYGIATKVRKDDKIRKVKERHVTFRGYPMDLEMFSIIICPRVYLFSAETNHNKDANYNQRVWQAHIRLVPGLKCISYADKFENSDQNVDQIYLIGHTHNTNFQMFKLDRRTLIYTLETISVKSQYRAKYYNIEEPDIIYQKTKDWLQCSKEKYFKNRKLLFKFQHFTEANVQKQNYLPLVRIVDPLECIVKYFQGKYFSFTSRLFIQEFLAFQPETCLQDSGIEAYYMALKSSDNKNNNERVSIIGPNKAKLFISMQNDVNDDDFNKLKEQTSFQKLLCIQINVGNHFITAEVDQVEAKKNNCWDVMIADSLNNSEEHLEKINKRHLEQHGVLKYLRLLQPDFEIKVKRADNVSMQPNLTDCGVHGARRFYSYWKYNKVFPETECDSKIMKITPFRLHMLEFILEQADSVSVYVSPSGQGNTFPMPLEPQYDNNLNQGTSGRPVRSKSIKPPNPKLIPDDIKIIDVDASPDDDDKIGKQIAKDSVTHSEVNLDFDRYLFHDMASRVEEESNATDNDNTTMLGVDNNITHQIARVVGDASIRKLPEEHSGNNEVKKISTSSKHPHLSQESPSSSSEDDDDTESESGYTNPKKPFTGKQSRVSKINKSGTDNESTDMESNHSSIKKKTK